MHARTYRTIGVAVAAVGLALVGACSGSRATTPGTNASPGTTGGAAAGQSQGATGATPAAGAAVKACGLVTAGEAAGALGLPGDLKTKTDTPGECEYEAPNQIDSVAVTVQMEQYQPGFEDLVIDRLGKEKTKKQPGLGDAAFSFDVGFQVQFHVWSKGRYLFVVVSKVSAAGGGNAGILSTAARSLTDKALSRL